jgi:hypothetical protein
MRLDAVAWFPNGRLVVEGTNAENRVTFWSTTGEAIEWTQLSLDKYPRCPPQSFMGASTLPDGRLGLLCAADLRNGTLVYEVVAYDWESTSIEQLVKTELPAPGGYTWDPGMSRGLLATNGAYSTLYWLSSTEITPVDLTLVEGTRSWWLPESIAALDRYNQSRNLTGREPHPVGLVNVPAWSPDGSSIAFWATLETIGRPFNFPVVPWTLYLLNPETMALDSLPYRKYELT